MEPRARPWGHENLGPYPERPGWIPLRSCSHCALHAWPQEQRGRMTWVYRFQGPGMLELPGGLGLSQIWLWSVLLWPQTLAPACLCPWPFTLSCTPQQLRLPTLSWELHPRPDCENYPPPGCLACCPQNKATPLSLSGGQRQGSHKPQT